MSKYCQQQLDVLDQLGFKEYDPNNENHVSGYIEIREGEKLFIEEEFHRRRIFIKIQEWDDLNYHYFCVYVMEDIGCDSIIMPYSWSNLSAWWMQHLKMSFCGHGFMKNGQEVKIDGI